MTQPLAEFGDLYEIRPEIYWTDFLLSMLLGWAAFATAAAHPLASPIGAAALAIAVFALNRAVAFTHEISHHSRRLPGFEAVWNLFVGFPLLVPTFIYGPVHLDHHRVANYGTKADPSYLPFAHSAWLTTGYLLHNLIAPALLVIRFLILAPIGLASRRFEVWLVERASAIAFNPAYRRKASPGLLRQARRDTCLLLGMWATLIALALLATNPAILGRFFALGAEPLLDAETAFRGALLWYVVMFAISGLEALRTLAEHSYENAGAPMDKAAQVADSNDIPGRLWTELWAPVGLHYHATHHALPGVPYHALPRAYRRLIARSPAGHGKMTRPGLLWTLRALYRKGLRAA
jgi:fatty acid desaturase